MHQMFHTGCAGDLWRVDESSIVSSSGPIQFCQQIIASITYFTFEKKTGQSKQTQIRKGQRQPLF